MKLADVTDDYEKLGVGVWMKTINATSRGSVYKTRRLYYEKSCIRCGELYLALKSNKTARFCGHRCHTLGEYNPRFNITNKPND